MKSYIERASLKNEIVSFTALSDHHDSVRMELMVDPAHLISDRDPDLVYRKLVS